MPRRAQLALALILLLLLAPLAGVNCGIACLAAAPHRSIQTASEAASETASQAAAAQHDCIRVSTCCHSGGQAICRAANAAEIPAAALLSADTIAAHDAAALAVAVAADTLPQNPRTIAARGIDRSPPGRLRSALPIPLRV